MKTISVGIVTVIIAVLLLGGVGYAFAASSSVESPNNGISGKAYSLDVTKDGDPIAGLVVPEPYHTGANVAADQTMSIEGYSLNVYWNDEPNTVRAWLFLDAGAWLYVDSVSLTINGHEYEFCNGGATGCTTDAITGLGTDTYEFALNFHYISGNVPYVTYPDDSSIWNNGGRLTFAAGNDDPL